MYGRPSPQEEPPPGTWREVLILIRMVYLTLAGPLLAVLAGMFLVLFGMWAAATRPILVLIPVGLAVAGLWFMVWRDKRLKEQMEAELEELGRRRI